MLTGIIIPAIIVYLVIKWAKKNPNPGSGHPSFR